MWSAVRGTAIAAGLSVASAVGAQAALTVQSAVGGFPTEGTYANFDTLPLGSAGGSSAGITVRFGGDAAAVKGSLSEKYAAPYLSNRNGSIFGDRSNGPDTTTYLSTGIGSITLTLPDFETDLGLLWGSVDSFNILDLYSGQILVGRISGSDINPSADGNRGVLGTVYVNIHSTLPFDTITAHSQQYAFEIDNIAFDDPIPTPEPTAIALLMIGILGAACTRLKFTL